MYVYIHDKQLKQIFVTNLGNSKHQFLLTQKFQNKFITYLPTRTCRTRRTKIFF